MTTPLDGPLERRRRFATLRLALSLVYGSGPHLLLAVVGASVVTSVAVAGQLLLGRTILDGLADANGSTATGLAPYIAALGALLLLAAMSQAVSNELRIP